MKYKIEIDEESGDELVREVLFHHIELLTEEMGKAKRRKQATDQEAYLYLIALRNAYDYFGGNDK
jgi:hypothetical protein